MLRFHPSLATKVLVSLMIVTVLVPSGVVFSHDDRQDHELSGDAQADEAVHIDAETAFETDAKLMAEQMNLPLDQVRSASAFQGEWTQYVMEEILPLYEDQISAIWVDPNPATRGYVRFVDAVPEGIEATAAMRNLDVVFTGGGEMSLAEQTLRGELAAFALRDAGYKEFVAGPDYVNGVIAVRIWVREKSLRPDSGEILDLVRERVASYADQTVKEGAIRLKGRAAEVRASDLVVEVAIGAGPMAQ